MQEKTTEQYFKTQPQRKIMYFKQNSSIVTDKNGVATSKKLEKGIYNVQEIETNKWYINQ